ncbi:MAG TPA: zinc-binding dehydrogenase, partial [Gaiellaceae bacterium]|nr:zinc-binding dehydrogenase [Gaiellaceae bacterium]
AHGAGMGVRRDGGLAERLSVPEEALVTLPDDTDPVLAGALGIAGLAGWLPVAHRAPVRRGETVLVLGATGTVGLVALQGARLLGAGRLVAAGRRPEALERARRLGADAVVSLESDDLVAAFREACGGEGPDLVVDPVWGPPAAAAARAAAPGARIVNIGQSAGPEATFASADVRGKQLEILGYSNYATPEDVLRREYLRLLRHAQAGDFVVDVETVPLEEAPEGWRRQAEGAGVKIVVTL